mgnify:CR=1 FL=1
MNTRYEKYTVTQNAGGNAELNLFAQDLPLDPRRSHIQIDIDCPINANADAHVWVRPERGRSLADEANASYWNKHTTNAIGVNDTVLISNIQVEAISIRPNGNTANGQVVTVHVLMWPKTI